MKPSTVIGILLFTIAYVGVAKKECIDESKAHEEYRHYYNAKTGGLSPLPARSPDASCEFPRCDVRDCACIPRAANPGCLGAVVHESGAALVIEGMH